VNLQAIFSVILEIILLILWSIFARRDGALAFSERCHEYGELGGFSGR
jgi:hypothetical protein